MTIAPESEVRTEFAVLGAVMYQNAAAESLDDLKASHFSEPTCGRIWEAIEALLSAGRMADPLTVFERLRNDPGLIDLGGLSFLADCVVNAPPAHTASEYAAVIIDRDQRKRLSILADWAKHQAATASSVDEALGELELGCAEIARSSTRHVAPVRIGDSAVENLEASMNGAFRGVSVGLGALDRVTGGIKRDDVWIIGGRSSMGKSIVGLNLARGIAAQGLGVRMFSLEMPFREVQARLISDAAFQEYSGVRNVRYSDVLNGRLEPPQIERAAVAARRMSSLPLYVTDVGGLTIDDIRAQGLRQVRDWEKAGVKPGCILIDHLGLIRPVRRTENKAADTSDTVNELKDIAKHLGCPIIALAQVNRGPENRADKRPMMGDLNWSGSIEQIADFVCLLYRQSYYDARSTDQDELTRADFNKNDMELLIQKNRAGPICTVKAWVDVASNVVRDVAEERMAA